MLSTRPILSQCSLRIISRPFSSSARLSQNVLPAAYYRGGTSRAVFFQPKDLPDDKAKWNDIFLGVLGSPDPYGRQLDGLGGGLSSLSKVCIVGPSTKPDADVDYTFVAIGVKNTEVDFSSNCGNMSSAVGPFAVDAKIFKTTSNGSHTVRVHNTNTGKMIHCTFPIEDGEAVASGNFAIDGVAGTAAPIQLDFIDPAGSKTGELLPTNNLIDEIDGLPVTCIDVGNPCCFVRAEDLSVDGGMSVSEIENHPTLLQRLDSIRRQAGVKMGIADSVDKVPGSVPKVCMVSKSKDGVEADLQVRAISVGQPHKAVPITVALSVAAASNLQGSVVHGCLGRRMDEDGITLSHASGRLKVAATFGDDGNLRFATVFRTARRLMEGKVFWK